LEPIVAASAGPYGASLADGSEYDGRYGVDRAVLERFHADRLEVLVDTSADVVAFETIPSLLEAQVLAGLLVSRPDTPAWVTFSCRDSNQLWDGTPIRDAVSALAGVDSLVGVGVNCTAPPYIAHLIDRIAGTTYLPIIVYPNSGELYDPVSRAWTGPAQAWLGQATAWVDAGASVLGGCCRVGPGEIRELRLRLEEMHAL
jgi:homocysteine S-methyltransferase